MYFVRLFMEFFTINVASRNLTDLTNRATEFVNLGFIIRTRQRGEETEVSGVCVCVRTFTMCRSTFDR